MTPPIILVEAQPARASDGVVQMVRFAGGGGEKPYRYDNQDWRAGVVALPSIITQLNVEEGDYGTGAVPKALIIDWAPSRNADLAGMAAYFWKDAPVTVRIGPEGAMPAVTVVGKVIDDQVEKGVLKLALADPAADLKKPILSSRYAGTGDLEGPTEWAGKIKARLWGRIWNRIVEPIDKANNIYALADPTRPLQAIDAVRDKGAAAAAINVLAWQGSMAATLAALRAAAAPAGGCVVAPSIACLKWWTQPEQLQVDVRGETAGGYVETAAAIASRIVAAIGGPAFVAGTVAAADGIRPDPVGWLVDDDSTTAAQALDALLGDVSLLWLLDPVGSIIIRPWAWGASVASAVSQDVERKSVFRPVSTTKIGYKRNQNPIPRGSLAAIVLAGDVNYADGTPVEALKPAEPGATLGATYGTNVGGLPVAIQPGNILGGGKIDAGQVLYSGGGPTVVSLQPAEAGATLGARAGTNLVDSGGVTLGDGAIKNLAISIGSNGALAGAGGGQVTIGGLGYNGDLSATAGDNMIRNAALATSATDWVVTMGTATRVTSTTAGDQPAYMRATGSANLIALNGGGTGTSAIAVRGGTRIFLSWLARADIANVTGGGVNARRCYARVTYYNAAGSYIGIADISDAAKAATNGEAGGCSPNWELHSGFADAPAASAFAQIAIFPLLGSTGAGKFIDVTKAVLTVAQAGADRTVDQLQAAQIQPRATVGENLMRNGDFFSGSDMWWTSPVGGYATADLAWRSGAAENVPGWLRYTAPAAGAARATYTPTRFDRINPFNKDDGIPVIPGKEYWLQFVYRSDGDIQFGCDAWFYNGATQIAGAQPFIGGPFAPGGATFTANTSGAVVRAGIAKITVPAGANIMFLRHTFARPGGSGATYGEISLVTLTAAEPGATVGARSGVNLVDSGGAALGDSSIKNLAISIGSNGALTGAGGGQVTIGGLGYTGALDADKFAGSAADTKLTGIESGADVTKNAAVSIAPPPPQIIQRDWQGTPKSGQFNRVLTPVVTKGGTSIRTDNATTYSITTSGVTATVNNTNGSADKGRITMTAGGPGSISLTVTRDSIAYGPYSIPVTVEDDAPPVNGGSTGGTDSTLEDVNSTSFVRMTSADSGETIFEATITAGQKLKGTAPLTYNWSHNSSSGTNKLVAKWQYSSDGGSTWNDFDSAITGSDASWSAVDLSGEPGSITANQEKSGLSAGTYKARLVGAKNSSSGNAITIATGAATLSVTS